MENNFLTTTQNGITYELAGKKNSYHVINHNTGEKRKFPVHAGKALVMAFALNSPISKEMLWESLNDFWEGKEEIAFTWEMPK